MSLNIILQVYGNLINVFIEQYFKNYLNFFSQWAAKFIADILDSQDQVYVIYPMLQQQLAGHTHQASDNFYTLNK